MVVSDALSRLLIKLYSQKELKEEKRAFIGIIILGLDEAELNRLYEKV